MQEHTLKNHILIRGAREHNLKNISLDIPKHKFTVITGLSGSGKSSLAFDTIYAEGQRRYVESLSSYARQFLDQLSKPDIDSIDGLAPAISIEQHTTNQNPRSTVGTVTEIYDYIRLLYAKVAKPISPVTGKELTSQTVEQITDKIMEIPAERKIILLAPIVIERKGEHRKELDEAHRSGFVKVRVNGTMYDLLDDISIDKNKKNSISIVVDRLVIKQDIRPRIHNAINSATKLTNGLVEVLVLNEGKPPDRQVFSTKYACPESGMSFPTPEPRMFSFNSPVGACPKCNGLGIVNLSEEDFEGQICPECAGKRLRPESLAFRIRGKSIADATDLALDRALQFFSSIKLEASETKIASGIIKEIIARLKFLSDVGLNYLSLSRRTTTLSGGELQRVRLATQIGSSLIGVLYLLDEPSIGLHQKDNAKLLQSLRELCERGNTVVVVEHDRDTMEVADHIVDMGSGAGSLGGYIVAEGTINDIINNKKSATGRYLSGVNTIPMPAARRNIVKNNFLKIRNCKKNNLKNIDVSLPLGTLICISGVSGSGKSTLVLETMIPAIKASLSRARTKMRFDDFSEISGTEHIDKVINIDQSPIGRSPRSNPATYSGVLAPIRALFAQTNDAKIRGFGQGRFSFNVKGGRCEACEGNGYLKLEMNFMPNVFVPCPTCNTLRFNRETLAVRFKGKNIADVLGMTIAEAAQFFENVPQIQNYLKVMEEVGLGYIQLGQSATTLSGGEAQRMKLSKELSKRATGKTLYVLDEPSTGLHFQDIENLLKVIHKLVDQGNTMVVIEHNLDILKHADYLIDLGPEGGEAGGEILAAGTPEEVVSKGRGYTAHYLASYVKNKKGTKPSAQSLSLI